MLSSFLKFISGKWETIAVSKNNPLPTTSMLTDNRGLPFGAVFTPSDELLTQLPIRLVGQTFVGTTLDTEAWVVSGVVGSGAPLILPAKARIRNLNGTWNI